MRLGFETLGNATLIISDDNRAVLATDPWLEGRCHSGSWALERKLTGRERQTVFDADYIWIAWPSRPFPYSVLKFAAARKHDPAAGPLRARLSPSFAGVRAYRLSLNYRKVAAPTAALGIKRPLKRIYRWLLRDPVL